jgi:hypothetical protein
MLTGAQRHKEWVIRRAKAGVCGSRSPHGLLDGKAPPLPPFIRHPPRRGFFSAILLYPACDQSLVARVAIVRKARNLVRVTGQLVQADTGANVWAQRYEGDVDDISHSKTR